MHFLKEHFHSKHKKFNTNNSASQPKLVNVLAKTWLLKPIFNKKCLIFSLYVFFISIFANICIKNAQFNLFYQYMLLLTQVKLFSNLLNIKKEVGVTLLTAISLKDMLMVALKAKYCR